MKKAASYPRQSPLLLLMILTSTIFVLNMNQINDWFFFHHIPTEISITSSSGQELISYIHNGLQIPQTTKTGRSGQSTVMGFATGYDISVYKRFVGSLRNTGFQGNIILALSPDVDEEVSKYLGSKNVTMKRVQYVNCSHQLLNESEVKDVHGQEVRTCVFPYDYLKARWGRFPLLRDYLQGCVECTGPVLFADVRDTFFQCDPFGDNLPDDVGLQVFEEDKRMRTSNWLVEWPVRECKEIKFDEPMLCSGTTIGTREAILDYLEIMHHEMKIWMEDPKCHFKINGDDQSIHNYLYYTGKLPFARAIPNRMGIVNTVGAQSALVKKQHSAVLKSRGITGRDAQIATYPGSNFSHGLWVGKQFQITDDHGYFTNLDGTTSCVVHQYDRYGYQLEKWLQSYSGLIDL